MSKLGDVVCGTILLCYAVIGELITSGQISLSMLQGTAFNVGSAYFTWASIVAALFNPFSIGVNAINALSGGIIGMLWGLGYSVWSWIWLIIGTIWILYAIVTYQKT